MRFAFESILLDAVRKKLRNGSIRMLKGYIQFVRGVRAVGLGLTALSAVVSLGVGGFLMMLVGLVGLLPIDTQTMFIVLASLGLILFALAGVLIFLVFREKVWLERAHVHELMDLALHNDWVEPKRTKVDPSSSSEDFSSTARAVPVT